jgi:hypothetical protein
MFIEVHTRGVLKHRWQVVFEVPDVGPWDDQVKIREAAVEHYLQVMREQMMQYFERETTKFYIVFESKLNFDMP